MANDNGKIALWSVLTLALGAIGFKLVWGKKQQAEQAQLEKGSAMAELDMDGVTINVPSGSGGSNPPSYDRLSGSQLPDRPGPNFSWAEFERSATAESADPPIDNTLTLGQKRNILWGVEYVLQPIRDAIGLSVGITGGARSAALNDAIGGADNSQHVRGQAVDIKVTGYQAKALFNLILTLGLPFDQLIWYDQNVGGHVHISWNPNGQPRRQRLHATRGQNKTEYMAA